MYAVSSAYVVSSYFVVQRAEIILPKMGCGIVLYFKSPKASVIMREDARYLVDFVSIGSYIIHHSK